MPVQTAGWFFRPGPLLERCRARYGDMFTLRVAHEGTWVMVSDPDAVKQVFTADPADVHAGEGNAVLEPIVGNNSVLLLDEAAHMAQRKLLLPPLHGAKVARYAEQMTAIAEREVARWRPGERLRLLPRMRSIALEVIMRTVFGVNERDRLDHLRRELERLLAWTTDPRLIALVALIGPSRLTRLRRFRTMRQPVDGLLLEEIRRRRSAPDVGERDDILSLLVQARHEDGRPMGDEEVRDELITMLIAGHETTATALAWGIERLVRHPDKLRRLRDEVLRGEDAYLDAVTKETLRLRPVLAIVARRLTRPMEIGGRLLPAGAVVTPCIYLVHRRADVYPEPYAFRPERFLDTQPGTYTWIPFGGGVRRCLGASFAILEMKRVLATVVSQARLEPASSASERTSRRAITLIPRGGADVVVHPAAA